MKTIKAIPYLLIGGMVAIGAACSRTNTGATAGSSTDTGLYSSMGGTAAGTSSTGVGAASPGAIAGSDAAGSTGSAGGGSTSGTGAMGASGAGGSSSTSGTAAAADMTAFMGTFATMNDPTFLMTAASSNLLEIQAGQMASQKATNADVRKYAQMMVSHHTKSTQELKAVATPLSVTLPQILMPVHQAMADRLMNKTGKDFDEAYMDMMETAHKMDVAMFEVKSKAAENPTVKSFATKTLPMLRSHHTMADNIEKKAD
jgi:putative membrane protein